ncbi:hypothetical protein N7465_001743 [Penicillium sp. CMV-2018d]|nr:hypothetical protein N7465_001743 [Penicillium sp. CMV-2018d]
MCWPAGYGTWLWLGQLVMVETHEPTFDKRFPEDTDRIKRILAKEVYSQPADARTRMVLEERLHSTSSGGQDNQLRRISRGVRAQQRP